MTSLENGDAILQQFATSSAVLENYIKNAAKQLADKDELIRQLSKMNGEYQIENELLHTKLAEALNLKIVPLGEDLSSAPKPLNDEQSSVIVAPYKRTTVPLKDYQNLVQKYSNDIKAHETSREKLVEKAHKLKETCKNWQTWGDRVQHKLNLKNDRIKDLQDENFGLRQALRERAADDSSRSSIAPTSPSVPPPADCQTRAPSSQPEREMDDKDVPLITVGEGTPAAQIPEQEAKARKIKVGEEEEPTSSQTTATLDPGLFTTNDGNINLPALIHDEPIFVSEQLVRKRKRGDSGTKSGIPTVTRVIGNGSQEQPIHVKEERYSSPVEDRTERVLTRTETLDLDEIGDRIDTPRKRRRIQLLKRKSSLRSVAMEELRQHRSASLPSDIQREASDQHSPLFHDIENIDTLLIPTMRSNNSALLLNFADNDNRALSEPSYSFLIKDEPQDEPTPSRHNQRPLQTMSTNERILPRTSNIHSKGGRRKDPERGARALHTVAEDGNFLRSETRRKPPESRKRADKRLEELLEQPTPSRNPLGPVPTPQPLATPAVPKKSSLISKGTPRSMNTPTAAMLPTPKSTDPRPKSSFKAPPGLANSKVQTPRYVKPLRERAVTGLRLEDFKPNIQKYPGMDASLAEPVRGREARRHMAGCTDPNCVMCGDQLRQLAADLPITAPTSLFASTQDEELTEDEKLIKYHLGDGFNREQIAWMSKTDRERLVLKAKEQIVAERYSKHRVKPNQRGKSPPGFWDIEMASTQELERQREEADRMEKAQVAERYREAMKGGGRWLFKDE